MAEKSQRNREAEDEMRSDYENAIVWKFIEFGNRNDLIRAMVLTSSLCNPNAPADILSDFDIEIYFEDPTPFTERDDWIEKMGFGPIMALWHWPNEWDWEKSSGRRWMRMVYFQDGTKMDICLGYLDDLRETAKADSLPDGYDIGYEILLDKDGVTQGINPPTYNAFILKPPSEPQYLSRIESFWMETTYLAKFLWRNDIVGAKFMLGAPNKQGGGLGGFIREVLEWYAAMEKGWTWKTASCGRHLDRALDPETRREMIATYAAGEMDDLWQSLFRTCALYRKAATKVGEHLGYSYPYDLDRRVSTFHETLRTLDRSATREELAALLAASYENHL